MPDYDVLSIERDGNVATLWLDRAEARNAMGPAFWNDLPLAMGELSEDRTVRAIVIAARGPHFSVGLDLKAMAGMLTGGGGDGGEVPAGGNGSAKHHQPSMASRAVTARQGVLRMMPQIIGKGHVAELAFTGKDITAGRAKEIGLVNDVLPDPDAALAAARQMAPEIAAHSPRAAQG